MNEYKYKPRVNSLPKLNLATLTTGYKSFYSNNSKNKASSTYYNTKRILTTNANTSIFSSRINSKEKDQLTSKNSKNLINDKLKKNKKRKIDSNIILYLTDISKDQTDDDYFAMSEVKKIDSTINKRINKNIIWKEKPGNKYEISSSKNRIDINNIKSRVKQNLSQVKINLRKEVNKNNYFHIDNIETIKDANKIIKRIQMKVIQDNDIKKKYNYFNRVDMHTFREQNRDICLKNILVNIIKTESNILKTKENVVNKALKEANDDFEKDQLNFEVLTRNEMSNFRMKEIKLDETIRENRYLFDEIKKRSSELKGTKDEVKKYIKDIMLFIQYENFIKKMIEKEKNNSSITINQTSINYMKIDFDATIKNIIKEYYYDNNNHLILTDDVAPQMFINLFHSMESNIINALEQRDLIIKEIISDKKRYEDILDDLRLKVEHNKKELDILYKEINIVYNLTTPKKDMKEVIEENENYINVIYKELSKYIKDKTIFKTDNICFNTFNLLHKLEDKLLNIMNILEQITENNENTEIFKNTVEKIKIDNKREKQNEKKTLAKKLLEEKHKKIQQRSLRFRVKGPIIFPPPWAINKSKKQKNVKKDEKVENEEILFYQ